MLLSFRNLAHTVSKRGDAPGVFNDTEIGAQLNTFLKNLYEDEVDNKSE